MEFVNAVIDSILNGIAVVIFLLIFVNLLILAVGLIRHKPWRNDRTPPDPSAVPSRVEFRELTEEESRDFFENWDKCRRVKADDPA